VRTTSHAWVDGRAEVYVFFVSVKAALEGAVQEGTEGDRVDKVQRFNGFINGARYFVRFGREVVLPVRLVTHRDAENVEAASEGAVAADNLSL